MLWLLTILAACQGDPPVLTEVAPITPWPGDTLTLQGTALGASPDILLVRGTEQIPLPAALAEDGSVTVDLPPDTPAGAWYVVARTEDGATEAPPSIEVWTPATEPACTKRYQLRTETHRTQRKIAFDRVFANHPPERHVFLGDDLAGLAFERTPLADGRTCEALWLGTADGGRWLVADDADLPLLERARAIADALGLPLEGA
ncbi:MAG: hypothetical protein H6732_17900 [Alphaproteobacteria bacterium]|nr:hypothetical protein [Alphaproteobacteria bacterium]